LDSALEECLKLKEAHAAEVNRLQANAADLSRALDVAQTALRQQFNEKEMEVIARSASLSENELRFIVKAQAVARKIIAKNRIGMIRMAKKARDEGILIAVKPTVQGESGWYVHPDQSIYNFSLQPDGSWAQTSPPLTPLEWKAIVRLVESKNPSLTSRMLSPFTQTSILHPLTGRVLPNVYIQNGTKALFVVRALNDFV